MFVGIDLAALSKNSTGVAAYDGRFECSILYEDVEIVDFVRSRRPDRLLI